MMQFPHYKDRETEISAGNFRKKDNVLKPTVSYCYLIFEILNAAEEIMIPLDIREHKDEILRIAKKHGVLSIRVFGSFARGEETNESDIDLLITVGPEHSRWFPGGLVADLEELTGRSVDVVEEDVLTPDIRKKIIQESILL